jgi:hypothetical protein
VCTQGSNDLIPNHNNILAHASPRINIRSEVERASESRSDAA